MGFFKNYIEKFRMYVTQNIKTPRMESSSQLLWTWWIFQKEKPPILNKSFRKLEVRILLPRFETLNHKVSHQSRVGKRITRITKSNWGKNSWFCCNSSFVPYGLGEKKVKGQDLGKRRVRRWWGRRGLHLGIRRAPLQKYCCPERKKPKSWFEESLKQ